MGEDVTTVINALTDPRLIVKFSVAGQWHIIYRSWRSDGYKRTLCGINTMNKLVTVANGKIRKLCTKCFEWNENENVS